MIAFLIGLTVAVAMGLAAYLARFHPSKFIGRLQQASALLIGMLALCVGLLLYPRAQAWQEDYAAQARSAAARYELDHTERMVQVLGSSRAYIEYLKARQEK